MTDQLDEVVQGLSKAETAINKEKKVAEESKVEGGNVTPKKVAEKVSKKKPETIPELLRDFVNKTGAVYCENKGTPFEKYFATYPAWAYLMRLHKCHVKFDDLWEVTDMMHRDVRHVYAKGRLVSNLDEEVIGNSKMCVSTNEKFLIGKPLSAAYGLVQTRLIERLLRNAFASDLTLARLEETGAEELDVDPSKYLTKNEEI